MNANQGSATVDTGAMISCVLLWIVHRLGIAVSEDSRQPAFGVGGQIDAHRVRACIEAWIGNTWMDIGAIAALSPDTEWSRRQSARMPILLGRDGFLDKFNVCFDEPNETMWLRRVDGWAQAGRRRDS